MLFRSEIKPTGNFGPKTDEALRRFQEYKGLVVDGVCGPKSWKALSDTFDGQSISDQDYKKVAETLGIEVAALKAVKEVESPKGPFMGSRRPTCLFEGHIFWKELKGQGINPESVKGHSGILFPKWDRKSYKGGEAEWGRLEEAWGINRTAALLSASYGSFQICGFNYKVCGCKDVFEFLGKMFSSELEQLELLAGFIKGNGLTKYLVADRKSVV